MPCLGHFYKEPREFVRGSMQYLYDSEGRKYLDCFAGVSVMNCGHCNPEITKKVQEQVGTLQHVCNIYLTENVVNLAEKLAQVTPGKLQKSFFCSTGSEATEGALLLASIYTGSSEIIALRNGLHGRTKLGMSVTGIQMWRTDRSQSAASTSRRIRTATAARSARIANRVTSPARTWSRTSSRPRRPAIRARSSRRQSRAMRASSCRRRATSSASRKSLQRTARCSSSTRFRRASRARASSLPSSTSA